MRLTNKRHTKNYIRSESATHLCQLEMEDHVSAMEQAQEEQRRRMIKESIGFLQRHNICLCHTSLEELFLLRVNWNSALSTATFTGSCWRCARRSVVWQAFKPSLELEYTQNYVDQTPPTAMFGKTRPALLERDLNLELNLSGEVQRLTGKPFGMLQSPATSPVSQLESEFLHTQPSARSRRITCNPRHWKELFGFTSGPLESGKAVGRGKRPGSKRTRKIPIPSSGTGTAVKKTLSWTSSAGKSTSATSCDGPIDIPLALKQKDPELSLEHADFGSPAIYIPNSGTPSSTPKQKLL